MVIDTVVLFFLLPVSLILTLIQGLGSVPVISKFLMDLNEVGMLLKLGVMNLTLL